MISVETAARQARERNYELLDEVRVLLVHGFLHLIGYDHEISVEESRRVCALSQQLLSIFLAFLYLVHVSANLLTASFLLYIEISMIIV